MHGHDLESVRGSGVALHRGSRKPPLGQALHDPVAVIAGVDENGNGLGPSNFVLLCLRCLHDVVELFGQ